MLLLNFCNFCVRRWQYRGTGCCSPHLLDSVIEGWVTGMICHTINEWLAKMGIPHGLGLLHRTCKRVTRVTGLNYLIHRCPARTIIWCDLRGYEQYKEDPRFLSSNYHFPGLCEDLPRGNASRAHDDVACYRGGEQPFSAGKRSGALHRENG